MKRKILTFLILISLTGCMTYPLHKPFVIISKKPYMWYESQVALYLNEYTYQDSLGNTTIFFAADSLYQIGDTIK